VEVTIIENPQAYCDAKITTVVKIPFGWVSSKYISSFKFTTSWVDKY
jgi:hypothetical protein